MNEVAVATGRTLVRKPRLGNSLDSFVAAQVAPRVTPAGRAVLVDAVEMAEILGIPRDALYELALNRGIEQGCYRVGNRWRFDPNLVLESLAISEPVAGERDRGRRG